MAPFLSRHYGTNADTPVNPLRFYSADSRTHRGGRMPTPCRSASVVICQVALCHKLIPPNR